MVDLVWRARAKAAAYVDLVLISIKLLVMVVAAILLTAGILVGVGTVTNGTPDHDPSESEKIDQGIASVAIWVVWAFVGVEAVINGVQIWAAVKLLNASEIGMESKQALENARFWKRVTTVVLVLYMLAVFGSSIVVIIVITIIVIWRGVALYIVNHFIDELEEIVTSQTAGFHVPINVIVKQ